MALLDILRDHPGLLLLCAGVLGLVLGSFLNVVILRLPRMMQLAWQQEAREILELPAVTPARYSLTYPPSHCPGCEAPVRAWQNIPVLSWLLLRGRCASCGQPISVQYPLVELASGLMSAVCAWRFGMSPELLAALLLTWALIALAMIDAQTTLLPDDITLPLLWLGLLLALGPVFASLPDAVIGAAAGYLSLWSVFWLFKLITGKDGMGYGDFKLFAALGAWLGWQALPACLLLASLIGTVYGLASILLQRRDAQKPFPFGPFLAIAGWINLLWGEALRAAYWRLAT